MLDALGKLPHRICGNVDMDGPLVSTLLATGDVDHRKGLTVRIIQKFNQVKSI